MAFRVVQGVGGALLSANSGAVLGDAFRVDERGRAFGYNSIGWNAGAISGILLGGLIITFASWRWIFWINVPVGLAALAVAVRVLHDPHPPNRQRLDILGMLLLGGGLFAVLWAMTRVATERLSGPVLTWLLAGIAMLVVFVVVEARRPAPLINLALFRIPTLSPTLLAAFFQALANFAVLFLVLMYLQGVRDLSPLHAALLLVPGYLVGAVVGPSAARLADRVGAVVPATIGLGTQIVALLIYAQLTVTSPLWLVTLAAVVNGMGAGGFIPANNAVVMKVAPPSDFGTASGLLRTFSNVGMVFSFSVAMLVAARSIPQHLAFAIFVGTTGLPHGLAITFTNGISAAFYASITFMAVATALSAVRFRRSSPPTGA